MSIRQFIMHPLWGVSFDTDQPDNIKNKHLRILYYNARSLLSKSEELCTIVEAENTDIVCIKEAWLSDDTTGVKLYEK